MSLPELWGGIECTVNRVRDRYHDQVRLSGHHDRPDDLDRFAELGIRALRYPVLWERTVDAAGWAWADDRLARLRTLRIRPIVGLVHHGSGPPHTHLLDDGFAPGLGRHAAAVAHRYPWVEDWTPINEPLTTARFAALYGHWYPHATDERSFWIALLNQIDATRAAMAAIRRINPAARLIQTDDLGRTYATPPLAAQAEFDNLRRWAGWDLLFGRVGRHHPLFDRLSHLGLGDQVRRIADDPCPPDIVGVNHYLTSDRFLDHRLNRYPPHLHGGNGRQSFADTEAVRALDPPPAGLGGALREAWRRYGTPLALTEVHNGCTREEQLRWAAEAWDTAVTVRDEGVDVRAVTAWSLLGSHGWDTLLTGEGRYESGVFDVADGTPRSTALASLWRGLPTGARRHHVASQPGWWRRPERLLYASSAAQPSPQPPPRPLVILGAWGALGQAFKKACSARGIAYVQGATGTLDNEEVENLGALLDAHAPWGVINLFGSLRNQSTNVDDAGNPQAGVYGPAALVEACKARGIAHLNLPNAVVHVYHRRLALEDSNYAVAPNVCEPITKVFRAPRSPLRGLIADPGVPMPIIGRRSISEESRLAPIHVPTLVDFALDLLIDGEGSIPHFPKAERLAG